MNQEEYNDYVRSIVEENDEEYIRAEGVDHVARICLIDAKPMETADGESVIYFGADPWTKNRIWPKDVIRNTHTPYPISTAVTTLHDYAVECLKQDLERELGDGDLSTEVAEYE